MPSAKVAVVGLKNSGKTIFHTTLFAHPSPLYRRGVTLAFPKESQRLLGPFARELESGKPLAATALEKARIDWQLSVPSTGVRWAVETLDTTGEFFASDRGEDKDKLAVAKVVDEFLDGCDGLLYLIDPSDDAKLQQQLGTLDRVLSYNARRAGRTKPIALVYTKADSYLPHYSLRYEQFTSQLAPVDPAGQQAFEQRNVEAMAAARADLTAYLTGRATGRQLLHYTSGNAFDNDLYQTFPISCVREAGGRLEIAPVWTHEPLLWVLDRVHALRGLRRGRNLRFAKRLTAAATVALAAGAAGLWWHGRTQSQQAFAELEQFRADRPGPENGDLRRLQTERFLTQPYVRFPYQFTAFLGEQRDRALADRKEFLDHHLAKLTAETEAKGKANDYPACFQLMEESFLGGVPEQEYREKVTTLQLARRTERNQKELDRLQARLTQLSTKAKEPATDLTARDFVLALTDADKSFLRGEADFAPRCAELHGRLVAQLQQFRYADLLAKLGGAAKTEAEANRQLAVLTAFVEDPLTKLYPYPKARLEEFVKRTGDTEAAARAFKHQEELTRWTDVYAKLKEPTPNTTARLEELDAAVAGIRLSFLAKDDDYAPKRKALEDDLIAVLHTVRYDALVAQLGGDPKSYAEAVTQLGHLKAAAADPLTAKFPWPNEKAAQLTKRVEDARAAGFDFRLKEINAQLALRAGADKAGDRVGYLDAVTWDALLGAPPVKLRTDLADRRAKDFDAWREFDLNGKDEGKEGLFVLLDKLSDKAKGKERADLIRSAKYNRWRDDPQYGKAITGRLEDAEYDHVRHLRDRDSADLVLAGTTFLTEWPNGNRREEVKGVVSEAKWKAVEADLANGFQTPKAKLAVIRAFVKAGEDGKYLTATAKSDAETREKKIGTEWAKAEFDKLAAAAPDGRIKSWDQFDKALVACDGFLKVDEAFAPKAVRNGVDALATTLRGYKMDDPKKSGVTGLELRVTKVDNTDNVANGGEAKVYVQRKLPEFKKAGALANTATWFRVPVNKEPAVKPDFMDGYRFFSGENRFYQLAYVIEKPKGTVVTELNDGPLFWDFEDDFFAAEAGSTTRPYDLISNPPGGGGATPIKLSVTIEWKGSKLHKLTLPKWSDD